VLLATLYLHLAMLTIIRFYLPSNLSISVRFETKCTQGYYIASWLNGVALQVIRKYLEYCVHVTDRALGIDQCILFFRCLSYNMIERIDNGAFRNMDYLRLL
jgi:hypothetical protein